MGSNIDFKCSNPHCNEIYHSDKSLAGRHIQCNKCGKITIIPSENIMQAHVDFKEIPKTGTYSWPKTTATKNKGVTPETKISYFIPLVIALTIILSFYSYLFPIPQLACFCLITWRACRKNSFAVIKAIANIALFTAAGLGFLLLILFIINLANNPTNKVPGWLIQLDKLLMWSQDYLEHFKEMRVWVYLLIVAVLMLITYWLPKWKLLSKFSRFQTFGERLMAILIVTTSFTFFAPAELESAADKAYYAHYRVIFRNKEQQERRQLIATAFRQRILEETVDSSLFNQNIYSLEKDIKEACDRLGGNINDTAEFINNIQAETDEEVRTFMHSSVLFNDDELRKNQSETGEENIRSAWIAEKQKAPAGTGRQQIIEQEIKHVANAKIVAEEAIEGMKDIFLKLIGKSIPIVGGYIGIYLETAVNTVAEYAWEKANVKFLAEELFNRYNNAIDKLNIMGKLAVFWSKCKKPVETPSPPPTTINEPPIYGPDEWPQLPNPYTINRPDNSNEPSMEGGLRCGACGGPVAATSKVGDICPYPNCRVRWTFKRRGGPRIRVPVRIPVIIP